MIHVKKVKSIQHRLQPDSLNFIEEEIGKIDERAKNRNTVGTTISHTSTRYTNISKMFWQEWHQMKSAKSTHTSDCVDQSRYNRIKGSEG